MPAHRSRPNDKARTHISRRRFLTAAGGAAGALALGRACWGAKRPTAKRRPNVLLIITDQQRYDTIRGLGYPYVDTPHLDGLIAEGVTFTNCYVTAASCAPSRASLFTGYYPHTTGILKNADNPQWDEKMNRKLQELAWVLVTQYPPSEVTSE